MANQLILSSPHNHFIRKMKLTLLHKCIFISYIWKPIESWIELIPEQQYSLNLSTAAHSLSLKWFKNVREKKLKFCFFLLLFLSFFSNALISFLLPFYHLLGGVCVSMFHIPWSPSPRETNQEKKIRLQLLSITRQKSRMLHQQPKALIKREVSQTFQISFSVSNS